MNSYTHLNDNPLRNAVSFLILAHEIVMIEAATSNMKFKKMHITWDTDRMMQFWANTK